MADIKLTQSQVNDITTGLGAMGQAIQNISKVFSGAGGTTGPAAPTSVGTNVSGITTEKEVNNLLQLANTQERLNQLNKQATDYVEDRIEKRGVELTQEEKSLNILEQQRDSAAQLLSIAERSGGYTDDQIKALKEILKLLNLQVKEQKKVNRSIDEAARDADNLLSRFVGIDSRSKSLAKSMKQAGGPAGYLKLVAGKMKENLTGANLATAMMLKGFEKLKELGGIFANQAFKGFKQATDLTSALEGARNLRDEFRLLARETGGATVGGFKQVKSEVESLANVLDITQQDIIKLRKELFNGSAAFRAMTFNNRAARNELITFSKTLERSYNISVGQTTGLINDLTFAFGMSRQELQRFQGSLVVSAKRMGLDFNKVLDIAGSSMSTLAKFRLPDLESEFFKLFQISEKTGVSIETFTGALDQFTTFEGALTAASKLNAAFGTTLDGLEIMDAIELEGPVAGIIKLREGLESTGKDISKLTTSQRKLMENIFGLQSKDLMAFQKLSVDQLKTLQAEGLTMEEIMADANKERKDTLTFQEVLNKSIDRLMQRFGGEAEFFEKIERFILEDLIPGFEKIITYGKYFAFILGGLVATIGLISVGFGVKMVSSISAATAAATNLTRQLAMARMAGGGLPMGPLLPNGMFFSGGSNLAAAGAGAGGIGLAAGLGIAATTAAAGYLGYKLMDTKYDPSKLVGLGDRNSTFARGGDPSFASGLNFASKRYASATVGDVPGGEMILNRTQRALEPGAMVKREAATAANNRLNLTVNLVGQDGKPLDSRQIAQAFDSGMVDRAITERLDKISLINT